jgi:regulator of sigma E protease
MIEYLTTILGYALPFLFVFMIVVVIHELGHFFVARWNGVYVEAFSVGMGKEIYARHDSQGTKWRLALLPLGGYCKMRGEQDGLVEHTQEENIEAPISTEEYKNSCYDNKGVYARMAIASAGPIANFVLAIFIFWGIFFTFGMKQAIPEVHSVHAGSPAAAAGFIPGDAILSINDEKVANAGDVVRIVSFASGERLNIKVDRGGAEKILFAVPRLTEVSDNFGGKQKTGALGIELTEKEIGRVPLGISSSLIASVEHVGMVVNLTFSYLWQLVAGKQDASQLGGPIRIVKISSDVAEQGFVALLGLTALLSISLGIINLFPIPVLDGGHILFYIIEAVKGSPLSQAAQAGAMRVGLVLILLLMVFVTVNDIVHLGIFD